MMLIKFASRSRPQQFVRAMGNIRTTTLGPYRIIVSADSDDRTMNNPQIQQYVSSSRFPGAKIFYGPSQGKIAAINRDMEHAGEWNILVNFSDDMQFVVRGWDNLLRRKVQSVWASSLDWFAHFNDGYVGDKLPTMSIMGRDYYQRDGHIYHHSYKSFSCDAEAMYVAMARGRHHYFRDILFKHQHPANDPRKIKSDTLYRANAQLGRPDAANYFERLNNNFYLDIPGPHVWDKYKTI